MAKLIICRGLPGSGKTYWADQQVRNSNWKVVNVCRDDIRLEMFGRKKSDGGKWKHEKETVQFRDERIRGALIVGKTVISSDTNLNPKNIPHFKAIAKEYDAEFEVKEFYIPVSEAEERDAKRAEGGVGPKVIRRMWRESICKPYFFTEGRPNAVCVDLDGTLADMGTRDPFQEQFVEQDEYVNIVGRVVQMTAAEYNADIIITSGRHVGCKEQTERWLKKNDFTYKEIHMRPNGMHGRDEEPDWKVKGRMYDDLTQRYNVVAAFDDRTQVVDMLRERGITVFQVADGRF